MDPISAIFAFLGLCLTILSAWILKETKGTHKEVKTNHGKRAGEYLEMLDPLREQVALHSRLLLDHTKSDDTNFEILRAANQAAISAVRVLSESTAQGLLSEVTRQTAATEAAERSRQELAAQLDRVIKHLPAVPTPSPEVHVHLDQHTTSGANGD